MLYRNVLSSNGGLRGFARFGLANGHVNCFDYHIGGGIVYTGLLPFREEDELGYAVASAHASNDYQSYYQSLYLTSVSTETSHEFTYKMKFAEWLFVQYDVQYIVHPSADPSILNATVGGVRLEVNL
jgi:porin